MKSENRHYTLVWKKRRKHYFGSKCGQALCPICSAHKRYGGNSGKYDKKKHIIEKERRKDLLNDK